VAASVGVFGFSPFGARDAFGGSGQILATMPSTFGPAARACGLGIGMSVAGGGSGVHRFSAAIEIRP